jgi:hypothetical protein
MNSYVAASEIYEEGVSGFAFLVGGDCCRQSGVHTRITQRETQNQKRETLFPQIKNHPQT